MIETPSRRVVRCGGGTHAARVATVNVGSARLDFPQLPPEPPPPATPSPPRGGCNLAAQQTGADLGDRIAYRHPSYGPDPRIAWCRQREHLQGISRGGRCFRGYQEPLGRGVQRCRRGRAWPSFWRPWSRRLSHASRPAWIEGPPTVHGRDPQAGPIARESAPRDPYDAVGIRPSRIHQRYRGRCRHHYRSGDWKRQLGLPGHDRAVRPKASVRACQRSGVCARPRQGGTQNRLPSACPPRPPSHLTANDPATALITCAIPCEANQARRRWHG